MSLSVTQQIEAKYKKKAVPAVRSGDSVRVHQKIVEGGKQRVQIFEGLVIRVTRKNSLTAAITVRRIASGVGVEKIYLIHSPSISKIEVTKRSKVRRNYLSYMRGLRGKSARLTGVEFDQAAVNVAEEKESPEAAEAAVEFKEPKESHKEPKVEKPLEEAVEEVKTEADKLEEKPKLKPSAKAPAEEPNKEK